MNILGYRFERFGLITILGLFAMAACSAQDTVTPYAAADDDTGDEDYNVPLYAYASNSSLTAGGYTYLYASGGVSPYTFSIVSGDATVNASTGYLTANSEGTVVARAVDSYGTSYSVQIVVNSTTGTGSACVYLGAKAEQMTGATESRIDLSYHTQLAKHVVTGMGVRLEADKLVGIYSKVAKLKADGTISTTDIYTYTNGDLGTTTKGEIYIDLPRGYYLTGVGLASDAAGNNIEALKLFGSKINASGVIQSSVECLVDKDTATCSTSSSSMGAKTYYSRYAEYRSGNNQPLIAWGTQFTNFKVVSTYAANKTITTSTSDTGLCPAE